MGWPGIVQTYKLIELGFNIHSEDLLLVYRYTSGWAHMRILLKHCSFYVILILKSNH